MQIQNPLTGNALLLDLTTRVWSGERAIHREADLSVVADQLPPRELMRDGVKQIVPGKFLAAIRNVAANAERAAARDGVRLLKGWAVPEGIADQTHERLKEIQADWNDTVDMIVGDLPSAYAQQQAAHPTWASMLKDAEMTPAQVRAAFHFSWTWVQLSAPRTEQSALNEGYKALGTHAFEALLKDVATPADRLLATASRKDEVTQATANATRRLVSKLGNFAFLDARIQPAVEAIRETLDAIPDGRLSQRDTFALRGVLRALVEPEKLWAYTPERAAQPQIALPFTGAAVLNF